MRIEEVSAGIPAPATRAKGRVGARIRKFLGDCRATVAIEFAVVLPVLCTMVFGLYEVTQGVITYMKVVDVANTVADLIGQTTEVQSGVGNTDFDNFYIAGQLVMYPSTGNNLALAVASVYYDNTGAHPTRCWHAERGGAAAISNPTGYVSGLGTANGSTVVVQATYTYSSLLNYFITSPIVITSEAAGQPRILLPPAYTKGIPYPPSQPASQICSG